MKQRHSIKLRLIKRFTVLFLILFFVVQGIVFYNFRHMSIEASRDKAYSVAGLIRDTITSFMVLGVIQKRDIFLKNIKQTQGLKDIRILRGEPVIRQFGPPREVEKASTKMEHAVLRSGQIKENMREDLQEVSYNLIIPYRASRAGKINCMRCHNVKEGEVLGAVSIPMDLTEERKIWLFTISIMGIASLLFFIGTLYMIVVFFKPYTDFFSSLRKKFHRVEEGFFDERMEVTLRDEAGSVASGLNNMMDRLSLTLSEIREKVALLIGHPFAATGNDLKDTAVMVDELLKIYNFKRTIENDSTKSEIYARLEKILEGMDIDRYTIYEVHPSRRTMQIIRSHSLQQPGQKEISVQLCDPSVLKDPDACRARRTGTVVDSSGFPEICPNFVKKNGQERDVSHFCLPIYMGGKVGGVIQMIQSGTRRHHLGADSLYLKSYLQEAAPVIEARTFMELLKEQSLVDQLTGLYNRRFLDEFVTSLNAQTRRRNSITGILMMDLDFFKKVNDRYGHDVGDKILQGMASIIKKNLRESDIVIRYGGEEILALLLDSQRGSAGEIAEKIRRKVEDTTMVIQGHRLRRTVSIGVAEFPVDSGKFWQALKYADQALYQAKEGGRNRVVRYKKEEKEDNTTEATLPSPSETPESSVSPSES